MSFYPLDFIFIGCIGEVLTHKSNIFTKTLFFEFSKMAIFRPLTSKIEFGENWPYGYDLYYGFGSKKVIHDFPQLFFINIGHIGRFIEISKKSFFRKKTPFFNRKLGLEESDMVWWGNIHKLKVPPRHSLQTHKSHFSISALSNFGLFSLKDFGRVGQNPKGKIGQNC